MELVGQRIHCTFCGQRFEEGSPMLVAPIRFRGEEIRKLSAEELQQRAKFAACKPCIERLPNALLATSHMHFEDLDICHGCGGDLVSCEKYVEGRMLRLCDGCVEAFVEFSTNL